MTRRLVRESAAAAIIFIAGSTGVLVGCSVPAGQTEAITVDGVLTVRGNVPFNAPILETDARNLYVLVLTEAQKRALSTPNRYRVAGRLYLHEWNGRPFAHIEAAELTLLDA